MGWKTKWKKMIDGRPDSGQEVLLFRMCTKKKTVCVFGFAHPAEQPMYPVWFTQWGHIIPAKLDDVWHPIEEVIITQTF